jgi:UDP-N-acetylmuramate dehydrogenase
MSSEIYEKLKSELGEELQQKVALKNYVSLGVGGEAEYFYIAKKIDDLVKAVTVAHRHNLSYFVLGGGYNVVPSDEGFSGLVIKNECSNAAFSGDTSEVIVDSGLNLGKLINLAASRDFGGLEFLYGVPGTVGGAVYGNAGAFGYEIGDFIKSIILLVPKTDEMAIIKKDKIWMGFSYRSTKLKKEFKNEKFKPVILTVKLQLVKRRRDEILGFMQENLKQKKLSQPLNEKSAGSFFKNISKQSEESAGYLLEKAGAKRMKVGSASFSKKHANFLVNRKNATASDVRGLAEKAKDAVREKFNKDLEEEIEYIGNWRE